MLLWDHDDALQKFAENLDLVLARSQYKRLEGIELVSIGQQCTKEHDKCA